MSQKEIEAILRWSLFGLFLTGIIKHGGTLCATAMLRRRMWRRGAISGGATLKMAPIHFSANLLQIRVQGRS